MTSRSRDAASAGTPTSPKVETPNSPSADEARERVGVELRAGLHERLERRLGDDLPAGLDGVGVALRAPERDAERLDDLARAAGVIAVRVGDGVGGELVPVQGREHLLRHALGPRVD